MGDALVTRINARIGLAYQVVTEESRSDSFDKGWRSRRDETREEKKRVELDEKKKLN